MLSTIADVLARSIAGRQLSAAELESALTKREKLPQPQPGGGVGILRIHGVLIPRASLFSDVSGVASYEGLRGELNELLANSDVKTIVLDVDSPGGSSAGMIELSRDIMRARAKKPVVAVAQYTMASAAYGLAAAATEIVAAPSSSVGSIGVYAIHDDLTKALEELGIKRTYVSAGKYKLDGNVPTKLTDKGLEAIQTRVDKMYDQFVAEVSKGRGVPVDTVRNGYGEGMQLTAEAALDAGMVDKIATLEETLARLVTPTKESRGARAEIHADPSDTPQELERATGQDRPVDLWEISAERAFLELDELAFTE